MPAHDRLLADKFVIMRSFVKHLTHYAMKRGKHAYGAIHTFKYAIPTIQIRECAEMSQFTRLLSIRTIYVCYAKTK